MSSSDREESPDWLRAFQTPSRFPTILSSESSSPVNSDDEDEVSLQKLFSKGSSPIKEELTTGRKRRRTEETEEEVKAVKKGKKTEQKPAKENRTSPEPFISSEHHRSVWALSSDSDDSLHEIKPVVKDEIHDDVESLLKETSTVKAPKKKPQKGSSKPAKSEEGITKEDKDDIHDDGESLLKETSTVKTYKKKLQKGSSKPAKADEGIAKEDEDDIHEDGESLLKQTSPVKAPKKKLQKGSSKPAKAEEGNAKEDEGNAGDMDHEEKTTVKRSGLHVSSSRLPLIFPEKVQRTKALVECEGDSIDLSGDVGAVGRVVISEDSSGHHDMALDLKGTVYQTNILPCRTFCVVSFGQSEAKIETIMNDFIQLKPPSDGFEAETMVEGTLDGFSFESDEEMDKIPKSNAAKQGEGESDNELPKGKAKKKAGKATGGGQKKSKAAGAKKVKKKTPATKKGKAKK